MAKNTNHSKNLINWRDIISAVIGGVISLGFHYTRGLISRRRHNKETVFDQAAEKEIITFRNEKDLELFRQKLELRNAYSDQNEAPKKPEEAAANYIVHQNISEVFSEGNSMEPMIGTLIPSGFDAILYGKKNTMKSFTAVGTMIQVALGQKPSILSEEEREGYEAPANVHGIYIDGENGPLIFNERYASLGDSLNGKFEMIEALSFGGTIPGLFLRIREQCLKQPKGTRILLVLDNLKSLLNDLSQNEGRQYWNELKNLRVELRGEGIDLTSITVAHTEKSGEKLSGSYSTQCLAPFVLRLDEGNDPDHLTLTVENSRTSRKGEQRTLVVKTDGYTYLAHEEPTTAPADTDDDERIQRAQEVQDYINSLDCSSERERITKAAEHFECSERTVYNRLALLKKQAA